VLAVQACEDLGHLPAEHPQQRQLGRLQHRHLRAGSPGRGGGLQPDPARADHRDPGRGLEGRPDLVAVGHPAQVQHAPGVGTRHGQAPRRGAGGQQQLGVADPAAIGQRDKPPQEPRLGDGGLGVVGEPGIDLDRHPAVDAAGGVVDRPQHVAGPAHVECGHRAQRLPGDGTARGHVTYLLRVGVAAGDGLGEDRRIGGHADHVVVGDQLGQAARGQPRPAQVVQPDRYPLLLSSASGSVMSYPSCPGGQARAQCHGHG
jgi:hypothetical protein